MLPLISPYILSVSVPPSTDSDAPMRLRVCGTGMLGRGHVGRQGLQIWILGP